MNRDLSGAESQGMKNSKITKDRGASMVEYALLVAIIAVLSVPAMAMAGRETKRTMTTVAEALEQSGHGGPVSGAPGDAGDPDNPGGSDNQGNGGDTGNPGNGGGSDDPGNGGDTGNPGNGGDTGNPGNGGGSDDPGNGGDTGNPDNGGDTGNGGADEPAANPANWEMGEPSATIEKSASQNHWWTATLPLLNGGTEDLVFTIVVTTVDDEGKTVSKTVEILVPAGEQLDFKTDDLKIQDHKKKEPNGILSVVLEVSSVTTAAGEPAPGPTLGAITVDHPALP